MNLTHDDLMELFLALSPFFRYGIAGGADPELDVGPLGMRVREQDFINVQALLHNGGLLRHAQNAIRSILSLTLDMAMSPHGQFQVCEVQVYLHCDCEPNGPP